MKRRGRALLFFLAFMAMGGGVLFAADTLTLPLRLGPVNLYKPLKVSFSGLADSVE